MAYNILHIQRNIYRIKKAHYRVTKRAKLRYIRQTGKKTMNRDSLIKAFTIKRNKLWHTAASISGDSNADDVLQEAFCRLWNCSSSDETNNKEEAMSMTAVRNRSIDIVRERHRHPLSSFDDEISKRLIDDDSEAIVKEKFIQTRHIIEEQLPAMYRDALWMRDYEGLSFAEIAEEKQISEANARQIVSRARKQVRDIYRQNKSNNYE